MSGRTGAYGYILYGWEDSFIEGATTRDKVFGRGQRITGVTRRENPEPIYELYQRTVDNWFLRNFEGRVGLEWILANPWFFKAVMGSVSTSGSSPYTHTFTKAKSLVSMEIEDGLEASDANVVRFYRGAVVDSITLTATVGDAIRARADVLYFKETLGTTLGTPTIDSFDPFTFANATLELPDGTVLAEVQTFELTITNNVLGLYGLGSRYAVGAIPRALDLSGRMTITMKDATLLGYLGVEQDDIEFKVTNGETGADERTITFKGTGVMIGEHGTSMEPNELVLEDLAFRIRELTIEAINNTSTVP